MKYSIIIPFANDDATFQVCLESVAKAADGFDVARPDGGVEIICVNGGADGGCAELAGKWAESDRRFTVVCERMNGPGAARNRGLDLARGEYVVFVDADDVLDVDSLVCLADSAEDIVTFLPPEGTYDFSSRNDRVKLFSPMVGNLLVWNAIYRRDMLGDLRFPELGNYEDLVFTCGAFARAHTLLGGVRKWYDHRARPASAANSYNMKRVWAGIVALPMMVRNCRGAYAGPVTWLAMARKMVMHMVLHVMLALIKVAAR